MSARPHAIGLSCLLLAACASVASPSVPGQPSADGAPSAAAAFDAADVQGVVEELATLGIETRVRPSDAAPMVPPSGERSLVRLLRFQVRSLALERIAGSGIRGADLDALGVAGDGGPVSELLAGWAESGATPAASWAALLVDQERLADPAAVVWPTVALLAFVADASRTSSRAERPLTSPAGGMLAGVRAGVGTPARLALADGSDFCAEVSAYLSAALGGIVDADEDPPTWLRQLIDLYAPQYTGDPDLLRRTVGAMALVAYATSMARPWSVNLQPDPLAVAYGIAGQDPIQGDVVLTVAAGADVFAGDVADCAALADAQLASVPLEGSSVVWDASGLGAHAAEISSISRLDEIGSAGLTYQTATESQEAADRGDPVTALMEVGAWVDRAEMSALAAVVRSILLGEAAGAPAGSTAVALYEAMEPKLTVLTRPSSVALIDVTYHAAKASPSPQTSQPPTGDVTGRWAGTWRNDLGYGDLPPATGGVTLELEHAGAQVAGTARFSGMTCVTEVPVEGTVRDVTVDIAMPGEWNIQFDGILDGDSMSGTYSAIACWPEGFTVTGTWQATRQ